MKFNKNLELLNSPVMRTLTGLKHNNSLTVFIEISTLQQIVYKSVKAIRGEKR